MVTAPQRPVRELSPTSLPKLPPRSDSGVVTGKRSRVPVPLRSEDGALFPYRHPLQSEAASRAAAAAPLPGWGLTSPPRRDCRPAPPPAGLLPPPPALILPPLPAAAALPAAPPWRRPPAVPGGRSGGGGGGAGSGGGPGAPRQRAGQGSASPAGPVSGARQMLTKGCWADSQSVV